MALFWAVFYYYEREFIMEKYVVKKGSVQETLIIPLYGRKVAMDMYPDLFSDKECKELLSKIEYSEDKLRKESKIKLKIGGILAATRQYDLVTVCKEYVSKYPSASVVNLGCGLDTSYYQIDNGSTRGYNVDFSDVIDIRNELLPAKNSEKNISSDITDYSWFEKIEYEKEKGIVFFASGVFYYLKKEKVKKLISKLSEVFPGGKIVFDATNSKGLKKMLKAWLSPSEMENVGLYFSLDDEKEIYKWSENISKVIKKGYLTGYRKLDKRYGFFTNMFLKYIDRKNLAQIIEIEFK